MNPYLALLGVLALAGCAATVAPREHLTDAPQVFHIAPVRPVAELLPLALAASPPVEPGEFRPADLVELTRLDPTIQIDIPSRAQGNFPRPAAVQPGASLPATTRRRSRDARTACARR